MKVNSAIYYINYESDYIHQMAVFKTHTAIFYIIWRTMKVVTNSIIINRWGSLKMKKAWYNGIKPEL